jgi:UDP-N-acetylmuramoyl-tripeptide--D-alanyl-D-alanine ligase
MSLPLTLADLVEATRGKAVRGDLSTAVPSISTDTRELKKGQWFLALIGPNFNGHEFLLQAVERKAAGLIVAADQTEFDMSRVADVPVLAVEDTLEAYGDIAQAWRERLGPRAACVAGSAGKTTVKEMVAACLSGRSDVLISRGNLNNLVGVPRMLLELRDEHQVAVLELGMNTRGELERLTRIAGPDLAVLTNIGDAHVGRFGSIEDLCLAKAELLTAMKPGGRLLTNADCPRSSEIVKRWGTHLDVVRFAVAAHATYRAESIESLRPWGYAFDFVHPGGRQRIELRVFGRHNVANALCAAALLSELELGAAEIAEGLQGFRPAPMRSSACVMGGATLIEDCYNASPTGTARTLESLADLEVAGRRRVVLGDMLELGDQEEDYHRRIGETAARLERVKVYAVGPRARWIAEAAREAGAETVWRETGEEALDLLCKEIEPGDAVLVKASRLMEFEKIAQALRKRVNGGA